MELNLSKCQVISFRKTGSTLCFPYKIYYRELMRVYSVHDLSVTFSQNLSYNDHIAQMISSASKSLSFLITKSKNFTNTQTLSLLFNALLRSRVEYADIIWNPYYNVYSQQIDYIQKRFSKNIAFRQCGIYPMRCCDYLFYKFFIFFCCITILTLLRFFF